MKNSLKQWQLPEWQCANSTGVPSKDLESKFDSENEFLDRESSRKLHQAQHYQGEKSGILDFS